MIVLPTTLVVKDFVGMEPAVLYQTMRDTIKHYNDEGFTIMPYDVISIEATKENYEDSEPCVDGHSDVQAPCDCNGDCDCDCGGTCTCRPVA